MVRKTLFLGSDAFSQVCLEAVLKASEVVRVICPGTDLPVARFCRENRVLAFVPEEPGVRMKDWGILKKPELAEPYDFIVSASFGHLIPQTLIQRSAYSLNVHASLLPRHRGASPVQYTLLNRDPVTGVSLISLSESFDKGLIYRQETLKGTDLLEETYSSLITKLGTLAASVLPEVMANISSLKPVQQDETKATLAPKINADICRLTFDVTAAEFYAKFRAFKGFYNTYFYFKGRKVIPIDIRLPNAEELARLSAYTPATPGSIWLLYPGIGRSPSKKFIRATGTTAYIKLTDSWVVVNDLQFDSKPQTSTSMSEFICSYFDSSAYIKADINLLPIVAFN